MRLCPIRTLFGLALLAERPFGLGLDRQSDSAETRWDVVVLQIGLALTFGYDLLTT